MEIGDLFQIPGDDRIWLARKIDQNTDIVFTMSNTGDQSTFCPEDECQILCNVPRDWPSVTLPPRRGRLIQVCYGVTPLIQLEHWVKLDEFQMGGSLYMNPELRIRYGDRLTVVSNDNHRYSVDIPRDFRPTRVRIQEREASRTREERENRRTASLYDHLLDDDD